MSKTRKPMSRRSAFFARRAIAKKAENTIMIAGVAVTITPANAKFAETIRRKDAESAFEAAALRSIGAQPIAA